MNFLDLFIILIVILQAAKWSRFGLSRGLFPLIGFWLGIIGGIWLSQYLVTVAPDPVTRLFIVLGVIVFLALIGSAIGGAAGHVISRASHKLRLQPVDAALGAVFSIVASLLVVWLVAPIFTGTQWQGLNRQVRSSNIIQTLNEALPPAPAALSRIVNLISPYDFPQVFTGIEPRPVEPVELPASAEIQAAVAAAGAATVRLESLGCGGIIHGSGFAAAPELVITNAHVVAGIDRPAIVDRNGYHRTTPVYFDPGLDVAVLHVPTLESQPLPLADERLSRGMIGVTLGYPGGGTLTAEPAGIMRHLQATGRDIYGRQTVTRSVYELRTRVESGNSGGPVVTSEGTVIGMIFARSESLPGTGYALVSTELQPILERVQQRTQAVDTGRCIR